MSGYKRTIVSISRAEYQKMHEAEIRTRLLQKSLDEVMDELDQRTSAFAWQELERIQNRQSDLRDSLGQYNQELNRIEWEYGQRMAAQQQENILSLQASQNAVLQATENKLSRQSQDFYNLLKAEEDYRKQQIGSLQIQIQNQLKNRGQVIEHAANWLQAANLMADFLQNHYTFSPELSDSFILVNQKLNMSANNLAVGATEAALVQAQESYMEYSTIRIRLDQFEQNHLRLRSEVLGELLTLNRILEDSQSIPAIDLDGIELPQQIDVDWWCQGDYTKLRNEVNQCLEAVQDPQVDVDDSFLVEMIDHTCPRWQETMEELIVRARYKVLGSQLRINIADVVIQALEEEGFALQGGMYQQSDMRKTFDARVRNLAGNEVVIHVLPSETDLVKNELHIESKDLASVSETELKHRAVEVASALNRHGLEVAPFQVTSPELGGNLIHERQIQSEPSTISEKHSLYSTSI